MSGRGLSNGNGGGGRGLTGKKSNRKNRGRTGPDFGALNRGGGADGSGRDQPITPTSTTSGGFENSVNEPGGFFDKAKPPVPQEFDVNEAQAYLDERCKQAAQHKNLEVLNVANKSKKGGIDIVKELTQMMKTAAQKKDGIYLQRKKKSKPAATEQPAATSP
eukprot:TRINITY_DN67519_c8_g4_i1.p1 TRINITY_DN67519_c8_g4~~TRINITY_DN67519_c8_g4_i1.p1  ORF type:complete len:162 (-),score=23.18 TRINITY_DN67519_c8_g4_i1:112-597(-)